MATETTTVDESLEKVATRVAVWFEMQATLSANQAELYQARFPALADACRRDSQNFAEMARDLRGSLVRSMKPTTTTAARPRT